LFAERPQFGDPTDFLHWNDLSYFVGVGTRLEQPVMLGSMEHRLYGGVRYHREWLPHYRLWSQPFTGGPQTLTQDQDFSLDTFSFHLDDTFQPVDRLTVNIGVRLEWIPNATGSDRVAGWSFEEDFFTALPDRLGDRSSTQLLFSAPDQGLFINNSLNAGEPIETVTGTFEILPGP